MSAGKKVLISLNWLSFSLVPSGMYNAGVLYNLNLRYSPSVTQTCTHGVPNKYT